MTKSNRTVRIAAVGDIHLGGKGLDPPLQILFGQVAEMDPKKTRWHVVIVHCSARCYAAYRQDIEAVADSFTVKKP